MDTILFIDNHGKEFHKTDKLYKQSTFRLKTEA